jgi:hypothetical protein
LGLPAGLIANMLIRFAAREYRASLGSASAAAHHRSNPAGG